MLHAYSKTVSGLQQEGNKIIGSIIFIQFTKVYFATVSRREPHEMIGDLLL